MPDCLSDTVTCSGWWRGDQVVHSRMAVLFLRHWNFIERVIHIRVAELAAGWHHPVDDPI
jgi:hypothetical protein